MRAFVESIFRRLPGEMIEKRSPEEVVALYEARFEALRNEYEAQLKTQQMEYEARLKTQQTEYEARLEAQRTEYENRLEAQRQELEGLLAEMRKEINSLKRKLNTNSTNSGIPPSKDPIGFDRSADTGDTGDKEDKGDNPKKDEGDTKPAEKKEEKQPRPRGGQKGHKGSGIKFYTPDEVRDVYPTRCSCGCEDFEDIWPFFLHQFLELPRFLVRVLHFRLHAGKCRRCGKRVKARLPEGYTTGFGPVLTALVGILFAMMGSSARQVAGIFRTGLFRTEAGESVEISLGSVMNLRQRNSEALKQHHDAIADVARSAPVNHVDETSWPVFGPDKQPKHWLWVMVSWFVAFFLIHPRRNTEAFELLVGDWKGFLVSDDYGLYRKWTPEKRQSCLAHLIRAARKLSEDPDPDIAKWGARLLKELRCLAQMSKNRPTRGEWQAWLMRMKRLLGQLKNRDDHLGTLAARLDRHFVSLYAFLRILGVEPTNNRAERSLRPAVVRRKISYGSTDDRGLRWTERVYSVLLTCQLNSWSFADLLVDAVERHLSNKPQDLSRYTELKRQAVEASAKLGLVPATP